MKNDNNQDPNNTGQSFIPTSINQGNNGLFIPSLTINSYIISDHYQIDYIKQFLDIHFNILL